MPTARAALLLACGLVQSFFAHPIVAAQRPGSGIEQTSFVSVGGIDQWISIRGRAIDIPTAIVVKNEMLQLSLLPMTHLTSSSRTRTASDASSTVAHIRSFTW